MMLGAMNPEDGEPSVPDNPWVSLWQQINRAEWVADIGLPMAVTVLALAFAAWSVRRQLRNDREIARQSIRAEQRAEAGKRLSEELREACTQLSSEPKESEYWQIPRWQDRDRVWDALRRAAYVIEDQESLGYYRSAAFRIGDIFSVAYHRSKREGWREKWQNGVWEKPGEDSHIHAILDITKPFRSGLHAAAEQLLMWDGHLPMPTGSIPAPDEDSRDVVRQWRERVAEEYFANVTSPGLRLRKLPSDPSLRVTRREGS